MDKKRYPAIYVKECSAYVFSKSFIVSGFTLRSFFKKYFIYFYLLIYFGCIGSSLLCVGYSLAAVLGLLIAVASLVGEHRVWGAQALGSTGFHICSMWAQ